MASVVLVAIAIEETSETTARDRLAEAKDAHSGVNKLIQLLSAVAGGSVNGRVQASVLDTADLALEAEVVVAEDDPDVVCTVDAATIVASRTYTLGR